MPDISVQTVQTHVQTFYYGYHQVPVCHINVTTGQPNYKTTSDVSHCK